MHGAVGCHVFAGGFSMGMRKQLEVTGQLEIHDFGRGTVEERLRLPFFNADSWEGWRATKIWKDCDVIFGNPRCTGFSTITSGYDSSVHGACAACTKDIWDLCHFGVEKKMPLVIWESVQQASSVGRPLLDRLVNEVFGPAGYRVCHLFLNAAAFGSAQYRRRYYFIAYRGGNFNVEPPTLPKRHTTVRDVIGPMVDRKAWPCKSLYNDAQYDRDAYTPLMYGGPELIPHLLPGECFNIMGKRREEVMKKYAPAMWEKWNDRISDLPFSLHCPRRLHWDGLCPTLASSCGNFVHPSLHRHLTVGEIASLMSWKCIPAGPKPIAQIAKSVCPCVAEWIGKQCNLFLDNHWDEDWESTYSHHTGEWVGRYLTDKPMEKTFNLTYYAPPKPEVRYDKHGTLDVQYP